MAVNMKRVFSYFFKEYLKLHSNICYNCGFVAGFLFASKQFWLSEEKSEWELQVEIESAQRFKDEIERIIKAVDEELNLDKKG